MSRISATSRFQRVAPLVLAAFLWCAGGLAQVIERFPIAARPRGIALGPDGAMWFTPGLLRHRAHRFERNRQRISGFGPTTSRHRARSGWQPLANQGVRWTTLEEQSRPDRSTDAFRYADRVPGVGCAQYHCGVDGNHWFTQPGSPRIGRITTSGTVTEYVLPTPSGAWDITAGPDGNIWFTKPEGHKIGRITSSGNVTEFNVPGGTPYGIAAGPDGNVWFTDPYAPRIGRITPTGAITQFPSSSAAYAIVTALTATFGPQGT